MQVGSRLGPYEILSPLGAGGMGEVYRATDTRLERDVAIKALPPHLAADPDRLARFQREAKVLASLSHPNIAAIHDLEEVNGQRYLVLELVEGESLANRLKRGPVPVIEALTIARQIAEALEAAHEKGIIHRDLKPGNVMVTPQDRVKVLDFGLARTADGATSSANAAALPDSPTVTTPVVHSPTIPGVIMGTAGYMSPEQARGKPVDKRSDIFSFGCVLYEMLTGSGLFAGETVTDSLGAILHREPDWTRLPSTASPRARDLLANCLAKDRKNRLHDISDARIEIDRVLSGRDATHAGAAIPRRGRELLAWSLAVLFALGAGVAWFAARRQRVPPGPSAFRKLNIRSEAVFRAAFSPDGKTVVYSAAGSGNTPEIFVVRPESPEPQPLGLKQTHLLSVSSRGDLAVLTNAEYVAQRLFTGTLARVPIGGGTPRQLLERVREADWAPDGERLAIIREVDGKDRLEFPIGNVLRETTGYFSDLRFNPGGDHIAYFEHPWKFDDRGSVNIIDLKGNSTMLADGYWGMEGIAWSPDGGEVFYSASTGGTHLALFAVRQGGVAHVVYPIPGENTIHDISREGRWLITQDTQFDGIMIRVPGSESEREVSWLDWSWGGRLSEDGRTVAFTCGSAIMGPNYGVCVRATDGSPAQHLGEGGTMDISRDGKWVLAQIATSPPTLIAYPVGPGEPVRFERAGLGTYTSGSWFRDGLRVLVNAAEPGKGLRFYVQEFKLDGGGGAPRAVTPEGTRDGRLSPDEHSIIARGPTGAFAVFPIDGGNARPVKGLMNDDWLITWCADGTSVLASRSASVPCLVERVDLESGQRTPFRTLAPPNLSGVRHISPICFSDDLNSYVYDWERYISKIFVTEVAP